MSERKLYPYPAGLAQDVLRKSRHGGNPFYCRYRETEYNRAYFRFWGADSMKCPHCPNVFKHHIRMGPNGLAMELEKAGWKYITPNYDLIPYATLIFRSPHPVYPLYERMCPECFKKKNTDAANKLLVRSQGKNYEITIVEIPVA
jgi:hypothetical protein